MNNDITNFDVKTLDIVKVTSPHKIKAIRELPDGTVIDMREVCMVTRLHNVNSDQFEIHLKSGSLSSIQDTNEQYRQKLIRYWRYFNGV